MASTKRHFLLPLLLAIASAQATASLDDTLKSDPIALIRADAGAHRLILLGEMHGTREAPALVGRLVNAYAAEGPVLLALEIHQSEHDSVHRYLQSDGSDSDLAALSGSRYWRIAPARNDGRRTRHMLELIEQVRILRAARRNVDIVLFDPGPGAPGGSEERDLAMAKSLRSAFSGLQHGRLLVLTGNVHAMLERPESAPPEMQTPMGSRLRDLDPYSVNITANGGGFWACSPICEAQAMSKSTLTSGPIKGGPWNLQIVLPAFTVAQLVVNQDP